MKATDLRKDRRDTAADEQVKKQFQSLSKDLQNAKAEITSLREKLSDALTGKFPTEHLVDFNTVFAASMVSGQTRLPIVKLTQGFVVTQMTPDEARAIAISLMEAADAAISDAFLMSFVIEKLGGEYQQAASMVIDFREFRDDLKVLTELEQKGGDTPRI